MMIKEKNTHEKVIKEIDLEMAKLKYKYMDKEIELTKAQTELASVTKSDMASEKSKNNKPDLIKEKSDSSISNSDNSCKYSKSSINKSVKRKLCKGGSFFKKSKIIKI